MRERDGEFTRIDRFRFIIPNKIQSKEKIAILDGRREREKERRRRLEVGLAIDVEELHHEDERGELGDLRGTTTRSIGKVPPVDIGRRLSIVHQISSCR